MQKRRAGGCVQQVMKRIAGRMRRRVEERNPEFDFLDDGDKKDNV